MDCPTRSSQLKLNKDPACPCAHACVSLVSVLEPDPKSLKTQQPPRKMQTKPKLGVPGTNPPKALDPQPHAPNAVGRNMTTTSRLHLYFHRDSRVAPLRGLPHKQRRMVSFRRAIAQKHFTRDREF